LDATGKSDDDAVRQIMVGCMAVAPDVTPEELAELIRDQARKIAPTIENPTGFLIRFPPKRCEGQSFRAFRETLKQRREAERQDQERQRRQSREIAEQILASPDSTESECDWARGTLAGERN